MSLASAVKDALVELDKLIENHGTSSILESIKHQLQFIQQKAEEGKDPVDELRDGKKFTFGILASREFSSPEELVVQEKIDSVTEILIKHPR